METSCLKTIREMELQVRIPRAAAEVGTTALDGSLIGF